MRLDEITTPVVARFRADLVAKKLSDKRINNILVVLSKPMKYAGVPDCETGVLLAEITDGLERSIMCGAVPNDTRRDDLGAAKWRMNDVDETDVLARIPLGEMQPS